MARRWRGLVWVAFLLARGVAVDGQQAAAPIVVRGRIEDAFSRDPIGGARVLTPDSSVVTLTDSIGEFTLVLPANGAWVVLADGVGYQPRRFELEGDPAQRTYVLRLEPAPFALEGITAEAEAAITRLVRNLETRRNASASAVWAFDRSWLQRFGWDHGFTYDLVRVKVPGLRVCDGDATRICVPSRALSFRRASHERPVRLCLDGWLSMAPALELYSLPLEHVALIEVFGRDTVRVYTIDWMINQADAGRTRVLPAVMGC